MSTGWRAVASRRLASTSRGRAALALAGGMGTRLHGHDPLLISAGLTFYAAVAALPLLLITLGIVSAVIGPGELRRLGEAAANALPARLGVRDAMRAVVEAGIRVSWAQGLYALLPASFYGEGLRRGFDRFAGPRGEGLAQAAWRGRLLTFTSFALTPVLLLALVVGATSAADLRRYGLLGDLVAVGALFALGSVLCSCGVAYAYGLVARQRPGPSALLRASLVTGTLVSGMLVTFVLWLETPGAASAGRPYGGLPGVATLAVALGWLYALHLVLLLGYVLVLELDAEGGTLRDAEPDRSGPRAGTATDGPGGASVRSSGPAPSPASRAR